MHFGMSGFPFVLGSLVNTILKNSVGRQSSAWDHGIDGN